MSVTGGVGIETRTALALRLLLIATSQLYDSNINVDPCGD